MVAVALLLVRLKSSIDKKIVGVFPQEMTGHLCRLQINRFPAFQNNKLAGGPSEQKLPYCSEVNGLNRFNAYRLI